MSSLGLVLEVSEMSSGLHIFPPQGAGMRPGHGAGLRLGAAAKQGCVLFLGVARTLSDGVYVLGLGHSQALSLQWGYGDSRLRAGCLQLHIQRLPSAKPWGVKTPASPPVWPPLQLSVWRDSHRLALLSLLPWPEPRHLAQSQATVSYVPPASAGPTLRATFIFPKMTWLSWCHSSTQRHSESNPNSFTCHVRASMCPHMCFKYSAARVSLLSGPALQRLPFAHGQL